MNRTPSVLRLNGQNVSVFIVDVRRSGRSGALRLAVLFSQFAALFFAQPLEEFIVDRFIDAQVLSELFNS